MDDTVAPVARRWELGVPRRTSPGSHRIHMDSPLRAELWCVFVFLLFDSNMFQPFEAKFCLICLFIIHRG